MTRLPIIGGRQLIRLLEQQGFFVSRVQGSHYMMRHPDGRRTAVPLHASRDIGVVLLRKILREVEIGPDVYVSLVQQL